MSGNHESSPVLGPWGPAGPCSPGTQPPSPPFAPHPWAGKGQVKCLPAFFLLDRCFLSLCRQLSEENANLQEYVEKETQEKKRLSRTNEELLWKLQTGDPTSPVKLSPTSPIYRGSSSGPSSPARVSMTPR